MSEQRKRLSDAAVRVGWQGLNMAGAVPKGLRADHLQAREDRKRLAERLRKSVDACCPVEDGDGWELPQCPECKIDRALLAEVDPQ